MKTEELEDRWYRTQLAEWVNQIYFLYYWCYCKLHAYERTKTKFKVRPFNIIVMV